MKYAKMIKWAAAIGCVCSGGLVSHTSALSLTLDHVTFLGELDRGGGGKDKEEMYINRLAHMTPNTTFRVEGKTYRRSDNLFDSLPAADFEIRVNHGHTGIVLDGTYDYLLARYGCAVRVVWYVGDLTGSYDLPARYDGGGAISHYSLFRSDGAASNGAKVSESGSALGLFGLGVTSLGLLQRPSRKSRASRYR